jgi:hypothetical protein
MSQSISPQHPAVVLRSHYVQLRALLAIAMLAVVGLTAAVVILATNDPAGTSASSAAPVSPLAPRDSTPSAGIRHDGGPEEGSRGIQPSSSATTPPVGIRHDGGPEEGTSGPGH